MTYMGDSDRPPFSDRKERVRRRDGYACRLCGREAALSPEDIPKDERYYGGGLDLQVHHIQPRSQGGSDDLDNLVTVCGRCHSRLHEHSGPAILAYREFFRAYSKTGISDVPKDQP